jgi:hypothetical protein
VKVRGAPEEAVRQAVVRHLTGDLGVPNACIRQELSLSAWDPRVRDRVDVAVFAASGEAVRPVLLVECKAPEVALDDAVAAQVRRYLRLLPARWIAVTNGRQFLTWRLREGAWEAGALPAWPEMKREA